MKARSSLGHKSKRGSVSLHSTEAPQEGDWVPEPQGLFCDEVLNLETPTRGQTHGSIQAAQQGKLAVQICAGV